MGDPLPPRRGPERPWHGATYYGLPAVKSSFWDWKVSLYIYLAGLAGSTQIIASLADGLRGDRRLVRHGRHLALIVASLSTPLLVWDLRTPQRWQNMLRIFRATSPMSIGTYLLSGFMLTSGLASLGQVLGDLGHSSGRRLARAAGVPAALLGAGISTYTAGLLAATSTPFWAATPRLMAVRFGASAVATAAAALALVTRLTGDRGRTAQALDRLAMVATAGETAASMAAEAVGRERGQRGNLELAPLWSAAAVTLSVVLPLGCHVTNRLRREPSDALSVLASLGVLAGGFAMRHAILEAGNRSAATPEDYFRLTQQHPEPRPRGLRRRRPPLTIRRAVPR